MSLVPSNRPAAMVRRVTMTSLGASVVAGIVLGVVIAGIVGWIVFFIGLLITGLIYLNFRTVMRTRGLR